MAMYRAAPELDPNTDQRDIADGATSTVALAGLSQAEGVTQKTAARLTSVGSKQTQPAACQRSPGLGPVLQAPPLQTSGMGLL